MGTILDSILNTGDNKKNVSETESNSTILETALKVNKPNEGSTDIQLGQYGVGESMYDTNVTPENVTWLDEIRAQKQPSVAKLGAGITNAVSTTVLDIIKDSSYLLDLENYTDFKKSSEEGFTNWLAESITKAEEKLKLPVYRTKASEGFSPLSAGWWGDNLPSIASTLAMIIPVEGAVKGLSSLGSLMGGNKLVKALEGVTGVNNLSGKLKGVTGAVISRQMEALMEGGQTYQDTYQQALLKLQADGDPDAEFKAKEIAGKAAASNYKLNWAALVQDIPEYMILHKTFKQANSLFSKAGAVEMLKTAALEGSEEAYQYMTDKEAKRSALIDGKILKDDNSSLGDRILDYAKEGDLWTSAFFGAIGGAGFGAIGIKKDYKAQQQMDGVLEMHKGILKGDPETYYRGEDRVLNAKIVQSAADNQLDNYESGLKSIISNPERIKDEDRVEVSKRTKQSLEQIEYAKTLINEGKNNKELSIELKGAEFLSKLNQKSIENRLVEINNKINGLRAKDMSFGLQPDIQAYKEAKLTLEAIKTTPALANKAKELESSLSEVAKELMTAYPTKFKSINDLNKAIISSHDSEFAKLLGNKALEEIQLNSVKDILVNLNTPEGREELTKEINKRKAKDETIKAAKVKAETKAAEVKQTEEVSENPFAEKEITIEEARKADIQSRKQEEIEALGELSPEEKKLKIEEIEAKYNQELIDLESSNKGETINENPESINQEHFEDDGSRKSDTVFKTNGGLDNRSKLAEDIYFRTVENLTIDGHKLLVVTKTTNPDLYNKILDQDPVAKKFEESNKNYKGIWTVLVDKNGKPVIDPTHPNYLVAATLETAQRIDDNKIQVERGLTDKEEIKAAREQAKTDINKLREDITNLPAGSTKFLSVEDKSKGLFIETDENGNITHSAFEPKTNGNRQPKNVLGRIFGTNIQYKSIPLVLSTFNPLYKGVKTVKGKLYTSDIEGRVFDLIPRLINNDEIGLVLDLLDRELSGEDVGFDPKVEIKKLISFMKSETAPQFQIYVNADNKLVFGDKEITGEEFLNDREKRNEVIDFLKSKRVNANNFYIEGKQFTKPSLDGNGEIMDYKEYLLSGENPMFGTDLKPISNENGQPNRRFIQSYLIYKNTLEDGSGLVSATPAQEQEVTDNQGPKVDITIKPKVFTKKTKEGRTLNRLASQGSKTKLTNEEINWFKTRFPNVPIEKIRGLIEKKALGQFISSGTVLLSDEATIGTLYHEAFHVVTQLYLTENEIDSLYAEASKMYSGKTRKELEEILAEDFVNYKATGEVLKSTPQRNTIFRRILNFVKNLLGLNAKDIQQVYERIDKGYYTNTKIIGNREFSSLNRDPEVKKLTNDKGTKFVKDVLDGIDTLFFDYIFTGGKTPVSIAANIENVTNWIYDDFVENYNELATDPDRADQAKDYEYILENWDTVMKTWIARLRSNNIDLKVDPKENVEIGEDESTLEEENDIERSEDTYKDRNLVSSLETLEFPVRTLLRSLKQVDKNFNPITNSLGLTVPVDFGSTYNYLLKHTVGVGNNYTDLYNKIESLISAKPELKELLERLGKPSANLDEEHFNFQTQFLQAFNKTRTNSIITIYDNQGNIRIVDANRQNEADKVKTIWENNLTQYTTTNEEGRLIYDISQLTIKNPIEFLATLGIKFDDTTLAVINSKNFDSKDLENTVAAIKLYIEHYKGDVTHMFTPAKDETPEDKKQNIQGRLNYILNLEAQYTSLINELSFISVDGKTEYSVGENNGLSNTINIINNAPNKKELFSKLPFLNTISTEGSVYLDQLFDKNGIKIDGAELKLELHNGIKSTSEEEGDDQKQQTRKGTKGDLVTQQIASILNGKSNFIVSADKSQEYIISLSTNTKTIVSPEDLAKGFNSNKLKSIFRNYFKAEFKRIAKFELDGLGSNVDIYTKNGGKWTIFQEIVSKKVKDSVSDKLKELKGKKQSYNDSKEELDTLVDSLLTSVDEDTIAFFQKYEKEQTNFQRDNKAYDKGFAKEDLEKYSKEQLLRTVIVTDMINSIEQIKLFIGDMAFYKDLYKRTAMFAGTKQIPRMGDDIDNHLNTKHPRKDGKLANGKEKSIVYADVKTTKRDLEDWISAYKEKGYTPEQAKEILGFSNKKSAYAEYDEGDAMGWGSMDFVKEFHKRLGTWTSKMENAYQVIQSQKYDNKGNLIEGRLLNRDEIALFQTLKLQYAGPIIHGSTAELYVPGGYKFTVMPLVPQMVAGRNLSKMLDNMIKNQAGIAVFKSGSKFGTHLNSETGKINEFYTKRNSGDINDGYLETQEVSYQYLGLQVKPSAPHETYVMATQFRKTMLINAFENGEEKISGAKQLLDDFTKFTDERTEKEKQKLIKDLGINPETYKSEDVTKIVKLLVESSEDRKLPDNIIDSLDVEIENGKTMLKYKFDALVNKAKIDSMLTSLVNSRLIKQQFNGDAYVLATVAGMERLGERPTGTNPALRSYTRDKVTGKTLPAEVMIPISKNYYSLLNKYGSLQELNRAIRAGKVDDKVLELVGCRIPGQGMNSNEYLTIKEFLPEDSATSMIAHPEIVAKAGSDFDNDKLYTYRPNLDKDGNYKEDDLDNKIIGVMKDFISHEENFLALITPNSTSIITPIVNKIKYTKYLNNKRANNDTRIMSEEDYINSLDDASSNIKYTDLLKLYKKIEARYKLWLAKDEVGPAAIANAYGPLSQIGNITANKSFYKGAKDEFGDIVEVEIPVNINLPHNETKDDKLNLSALKDAENKEYISEINNQLINIIVDAAKDEEPMVSYLNMTMETLSIYLYLNRLGVPFNISSNFMAQPIISEYLQENSVNKSLFLRAVSGHEEYGVLRGIEKRYTAGLSKKDLADYKDKVFTLKELEDNLLSENQNTKEFKLSQLQVLRDFQAYKEQAQLFGDAVRLTNSDSAGLGQNINASRLKLQDFYKVNNDRFINGIDNIMNKTFIKSFAQDEFAIKAYENFYYTQDPEIVDGLLSMANRIADREGIKSRKDKLKLMNTIENDFINYVVQNYGYKNITQVRDRLFKGKDSVAKRLLALKNKPVSKLTDQESKVVNNILVKELFPLIGKADPKTDYDNIKIYSRKLDTFKSNQLTEAFRELRDIDMKLASDLMHVGIIQSGLNNSPITYLGLIPHEYYNTLVKNSFEKLSSKKNGVEEDLRVFSELFSKNRRGKLGFGMYGKDFDGNKLLNSDKNSILGEEDPLTPC